MRHYIDASVHVYLREADGRWVIDRATVDGFALDASYEQHPRNGGCPCDAPDECEAARVAAGYIELPTGAELAVLLNQALDPATPAGLVATRTNATSDFAFMRAAVSGDYGAAVQRIATEVAREVEAGPDVDVVGANLAADEVIKRITENEEGTT